MLERQILPRFIVALCGAFASLLGYGLIEAVADRGFWGARYVDIGNDLLGPASIAAVAIAATLLIAGALVIGLASRRLSGESLRHILRRVSSASMPSSLSVLIMFQVAIVVAMELCESHGYLQGKSLLYALGGPSILVLVIQAALAGLTLVGVRRASQHLTRVRETLRVFLAEFIVLISDVTTLPAPSGSLAFTDRAGLHTVLFVRTHGLRAPPTLAA